VHDEESAETETGQSQQHEQRRDCDEHDPGWTAARIVLVTISALLMLLTLACLGLGAFLIVDGFPNWFMVPGVLLILVAVALRPRLGRAPRRGALRREEVPTLYALIDRVAAAAGAP